MLKSKVLLACSLMLAAGCGQVVIGQSCGSKGDCGGKHPFCDAGPNGGKKICTHSCLNIADCPLGYDCGDTGSGDGRTCYKTLYATDPTTGDPLLFAKSCAPGDDSVCMGTGDPNPNPTCRKTNNPNQPTPVALDSDPGAYCTGSCTNDFDCPLPMKCDTDYDGAMKCLKRTVCDDCTSNDNCGYISGVFQTDYIFCVPASNGGKSYCSKQCNTDNDCPGASKYSKWMQCQSATDTDGNSGMYCLDWYGSCLGTGNICDPCKTDADCTAPAKCIDNPYGLFSYPVTGERMCDVQCNSNAACASPNTGISCDDRFSTSLGICTGDPNGNKPGVFGCHL